MSSVGRAGAAITIAALALVSLSACGTDAAARPHVGDNASSAVSYGSLPSFLPSSTIEPDSVLTGSPAHPALTTEGDAVEVQLSAGRVRATVNGPEVPGEGLPFQTPATTCTWTVTLTAATASVAIALDDFTTIDHLGAVYHVAAVDGQPAIPAALAAGQTTTFELRAVMPTGEGLMRWAPGGGQIVASWDFEVETD